MAAGGRAGPALRGALAAGAVGAYTGLLWWAGGRWRLPDVPLLYLPLVVGAGLLGAIPGVVAALASTAAYHVLFVAPAASLRVALVSDAVSVAAYLVTTVALALLLARERAAAVRAARTAQVATALRRVAAAGLALAPLEARQRVAELVASSVGAGACAIWMGEGERVSLWSAHGVAGDDPVLAGAAGWVAREARAAEVGSRSGVRFRYAAVRGRGGLAGAIAVEAVPGAVRLLEDPDFLEGLSGLVALLWSRAVAAEQQVEAEAARRSDQLKTALLSMVSHELRSPLTAIKATVGSLLHTAPPGEDREALAAIESETDRLSKVVQSLLDASRVEAGQLRPSPQPLRLRRLIGEVAEGAGVGEEGLDLAVPPDLYVDADPVQARQLVQNLLENAERHGRGPVRVEAEARGAWVRVRVRDRGPGVPAELLDRIFDRFVRLGRKGLGLGLALCRAIVEAHGGTIGAENHPEGGLVVTFTLPAARGPVG